MKSGRWLFITSVVTILALFGCKSAGVDGELFPEEPGSLTITIDEQVSRSILPDISMDPASYLVAGVGPGTAAFSDVITGTSLTKSNLAFGTWTVTVTARNATPTAIGSGTGNTTVISNSSVTLPITVVPYSGNGTLNLSLSWTAADVQTAGVVSTLTPLGGTSAPLTFTVNGAAGTASFSAADVAAGYYTLSVKLQDNGATVASAVEVVRIASGQTTTGSFSFTPLNKATGSLVVTVTPEMDIPLAVSIAGGAATKTVAEVMALTASVSNYTGTTTYAWYVNGDSVGNVAAYSFGNTFAAGYYRIDVTAFSANMKRAGSATQLVQVVP